MAGMTEVHREFEFPLREIALMLAKGAVVGLATDTTYALVAALSSKKGVERLREMRRVAPSKPLSILMKDLAEISRFAYVDRIGYRLMKRLTPGPFTFILRATKEVPRMTLTKQRTVGVRVPDVPIVTAILDALGEPLISGSAVVWDVGYAEDPDQILKCYAELDLLLDAGHKSSETSTVIDLTGTTPEIVRMGSAEPDLTIV